MRAAGGQLPAASRQLIGNLQATAGQLPGSGRATGWQHPGNIWQLKGNRLRFFTSLNAFLDFDASRRSNAEPNG
jgi:hypothetical protein